MLSSLRSWLMAILSVAPAIGQDPTPAATHAERALFRNLNGTFQLELPAGWRLLTPNEAVRIGEQATAPRELRLSQPRSFYAVGPVEAWLAGDFDGAWLYVVEQRDEWVVDEEFEATLRESWRREGDATGRTHALREVQKERVGTQRIEVVTAHRTTSPAPAGTPADPGIQRAALDVHAPNGSQQVTLSFSAPANTFDRWLPEFRASLATLTFAREPREPPTLSDRLWTPLTVGGVVGIVLVVLYRRNRARR